MKLLKIIIDSFLTLIIIFLSYLIPKKKGVMLFGTADGINFKDNPKYLYHYLLNNERSYKPIWATKNKILYKQFLLCNMPVTYVYSLKHIYTLLRADIIVSDDTENPALYNSLLSFLGRFNLLLTWHGTGFKNIGLLDDKYTRNTYKFSKILFFLRKKIYNKYFFIIATSDKDKERKQLCFQNDNVFVVGAPRNDIFFNREIKSLLKKKYNLIKYRKIILYAPTFRETNKFEPFSKLFYDRLNEYLIKTNSIFVIKKHKYDKALQVPDSYKNIIDFTLYVDDVQELLAITDLLISDYSGIVSDFVLTGNPMLFYIYDYENYIKNCRTFTYDLKQILPGPFIHDERDLFKYIYDDKWFKDIKYIMKYQQFKELFQKYEDGRSSQRVVEMLKNMKY